MAVTPNFADDEHFDTFLMQLCIVLFGLLTVVYVGFNRLVVVPILVAGFSAAQYFVMWYVWRPISSGTSDPNTPINTCIAYIIFTGGDFTIVFYGYFLLEKLLPRARDGWLLSRGTFLIIFWIMQVTNGALRVSAWILAALSIAKQDQAELSDHLNKMLYNVCLVFLIVVTSIEIFSGYLLIILFRRSRKVSIRFLGGKRVGFFKHLVLSTEVRVTSFALITGTRAVIELAKRNKNNKPVARLDNTTILLAGIYPLFLMADCIFRKGVGLETQLQERINNPNGNHVMTAAQRLGIMGSVLPSVVDNGNDNNHNNNHNNSNEKGNNGVEQIREESDSA